MNLWKLIFKHKTCNTFCSYWRSPICVLKSFQRFCGIDFSLIYCPNFKSIVCWILADLANCYFKISVLIYFLSNCFLIIFTIWIFWFMICRGFFTLSESSGYFQIRDWIEFVVFANYISNRMLLVEVFRFWILRFPGSALRKPAKVKQ